MGKVHPSFIRQNVENVSRMLNEVFLLNVKEKDKIGEKKVLIEKKLEDMENIDFLKEYCNNVRKLLSIFTKDPTAQSGSDSLVSLLALNAELRVKIIQEYDLCSEPDPDD